MYEPSKYEIFIFSLIVRGHTEENWLTFNDNNKVLVISISLKWECEKFDIKKNWKISIISSSNIFNRKLIKMKSILNSSFDDEDTKTIRNSRFTSNMCDDLKSSSKSRNLLLIWLVKFTMPLQRIQEKSKSTQKITIKHKMYEYSNKKKKKRKKYVIRFLLSWMTYIVFILFLPRSTPSHSDSLVRPLTTQKISQVCFHLPLRSSRLKKDEWVSRYVFFFFKFNYTASFSRAVHPIISSRESSSFRGVSGNFNFFFYFFSACFSFTYEKNLLFAFFFVCFSPHL